MGENTIRLIDVNSVDEWNSIVKSFRDYDVYSMNEYVRAFQLHGDGQPQLFYYEGDGLRGFNVVMKRDIADCRYFYGKIEPGVWFDLATPYGYGGWLLEGDGDIAALDEAYTCHCRQQNIVSEFVRFHPMWDNAQCVAGMYDVVPLGSTIAMDLKDEETIWENIISKNRNMIRKAQRNDITIEIGRSSDKFSAFKKMYNAVMDKDQATEYYYFEDAFYDSVCNDLAQNSRIFTAYYENKPIAAAIMIYANGRLNYHLSGSDTQYRSLAPTNLILYEAAVWGSRKGYKTFHLGGGLGSSEDNLYRFKRAFYKGEPRQFAIGRKIFNQDVYNELKNQRCDAPPSGFFPVYRRPD